MGKGELVGVVSSERWALGGRQETSNSNNVSQKR